MTAHIRSPRRLDWWLALLCSLLACALQARWFLHAGALWRDEVNSASLGLLPTWGEFYHNLQFGSFPLLWMSLVRVLAQGGIASDGMLRALGLVVGLANVAILWVNSRRFGTGSPLIAVALLSINATVICWGNSNGAFGLGLLLALALVSLIWQLANEPTAKNTLLVLAIALLAVHTVFYNAVILFALGAGGTAVAIARKDWKPVAAIAGIGLITALSLGIYLPVFAAARGWNVLLRIPRFEFTHYLRMLAEAFSGNVGPVPTILWVGTLLAALILGIVSLLRRPEPRARVLSLYGLTIMVAGFFAYYGFLVFLSYSTSIWYYLALMGILAQAADLVLIQNWEGESPSEPTPGSKNEIRSLLEFRGGNAAFTSQTGSAGASPTQAGPSQTIRKSIRIILALASAGVVFPLVWTATGERYTNIDLIAAKIESQAGKNDLVIVSPWACGITFQRYFHGPTPWITIPPIPSPRFHRFDLYKAMMSQPEPAAAILPVLDKIQSSLRSGGKVWLVGNMQFLRKGAKPFLLGPAPTREFGWDNGLYHLMWTEQVAYFFQLHALAFHQVNVPTPGPVRELEKLPVAVIEGWRGESPKPSSPAISPENPTP